MKSLVLAEKPSVARDIARVLKCNRNISGAIEGDRYIVTWALGHLVALADPEEYDKKFKEWSMDSLPMLPEKRTLVVIKQTSPQYNHVKAQLFRKDVSDIIIATDAGREGELVARWILDKSGCHKPIKRLWISSVTDKAIREGFQHLQDGRRYNNLYYAAEARAEADWLVGINATRALTCKYNAQLSCGRVQTPTLSIISHREEEIKHFKPEDYYCLRCSTGSGNTRIAWTWQHEKNGSTRSFSKDFLLNLEKQLCSASLHVCEIHTAAKKIFSPGLYDLTELQRDANRRYNFSAKETLNIMQRLYENHKALTYPRTDSRYIGQDIVPTIKERLKACCIGPYKPFIAPILREPLRTNKTFVDDKRVSDHHAIIPTEEYIRLEHMTNEERKIYDLVVRRFISVLSAPFEYEQTSIKASACGQTFTAKGKITLSAGWHKLYDTWEESEAEEEYDSLSRKDQQLPSLKKGTALNVSGTDIIADRTKPPARFTEAALLSAMENPVKYMESKDSKARKTLGNTGGLGTVATRADIIEKLFHSFLIEKKGNEIFLTSKGKQLLELVPEDLKKPELTAAWEMQLSDIADGHRKKENFLEEIKSCTKTLINEIRTADGTFRHDNITNTKCPRCGKRMLAVNGKNARLLVCQDRECGYRETIARLSNARCPNCHKKMEIIKKGEEETFVCACGYKEKMTAFKARREKEGAGVSKKDVQKYLKKQKNESVNTLFADALAGIKLD